MVAEKDTFSFCVSGIAFGFAFWIRAFPLSHSDSRVPTIAFGFAFWIRVFLLSHSDSLVAFWIRLLDENNKYIEKFFQKNDRGVGLVKNCEKYGYKN